MKKAKLIYNPVSGDGGFKHHLDAVVDIFQERGYLVELNRTSKNTNLVIFLKPLSMRPTQLLSQLEGMGR